MWYQDVARYFSEDFSGIEGSIPASIHEDEVISHDYTITLPDNILNDANTELCVLLLNAKNGSILNADRLSLSEYFSGVTAVENDAPITLSLEGDNLSVNAPAEVAVEIYSADGRLVRMAELPESGATISMGALKGLYVVKATSGGVSVVKKYIL